MNSGYSKWLSFLAIGALTLSVSACAVFGAATPSPEAVVVVEGGIREGEETGGRIPDASLGPAAATMESRSAAVPAEADYAREAPAVGAAVEGGPAVYPPAPAGDGNPIVPPDRQFFGPLQAGEIDDNAEFAAYLQYRFDYHQYLNYPVEELDVTERHIIRVTNREGLPVLGAQVTIANGQRTVTTLLTTASGKVYFFPRAYPYADAPSYNVTVRKGQASQSFTLTREQRDALWEVTLDVPRTRPPIKLDVLFLVDSTGSMSDEIEQLKDNMLSISAQIEALPEDPDVRFGLVYYRDRGDVYVVRTVDFTDNVQQFQRELMAVSAGGGDDTPESLNEALHYAVSGMRWRIDDTVSLIFLVADAPPHLDYAQDYSYAEELLRAVQMGIKIFPIGSRLDGEDFYQDQAEYIFRQMAQFTGGHFIFLTYADTPQSSGEPGTEYSVPEGRYTVEDLDALVVKLVREELAALTGQQ